MSSIYLDKLNRLHHDGSKTTCPQCGAVTHQTVLAYPDFAKLQRLRPAMMGVVLQCDACRVPLFRRYRLHLWRDDRIEFHPAHEDLERPVEQFPYAHLPMGVASSFREALACYSAGLLQAFPAMCRLTMNAMLEDLGERSRLRVFDQIAEIRTLAQIDDASFSALRRVLLDNDPTRVARAAPLEPSQAGLLLELMKDLLYQIYVRQAKLIESLQRRDSSLFREAPALQTPQDVQPSLRIKRQ